MLAFNCYLTGYIHGEDGMNLKKFVKLMLFGFPWFLYEVGRAVLIMVWNQLDVWFKLTFWYHYLIKKDISRYTGEYNVGHLDKYYKDNVENVKWYNVKAKVWLLGYRVIKKEAQKD